MIGRRWRRAGRSRRSLTPRRLATLASSFSEAAFQLAVVLASVSIVARTPALLVGSSALGAVGLLLALNAATALITY